MTVNIRPGIYELQADPENKAIHMLVDASSSGNIKPASVMDAYAAWQGQTLAENAFTVHRKDTYLNLASAGEARQLAPMDSIGRQILEPIVDEKRLLIAQEADRRRAEAAAEARRLRQEALTAKETEQQKWLQSLHSAGSHDRAEERPVDPQEAEAKDE